MADALMEKGLRMRRRVLGRAYVERSLGNADEYTRPMQEWATQAAWGLVWSRPGIPRVWRSVMNLGMLVALNMPGELAVHIRGALRNGVTRRQVSECLLHAACYCGAPAAMAAFRVMKQVFAEEDAAAARPAARRSRVATKAAAPRKSRPR